MLEDIKLEGAKGILINITAGEDLTGDEFEEIGEIVKEYASEEAEIIPGYVVDKTLQDSIRVTVVLTGLDQRLDISSDASDDFNGQFPELDKPIPLVTKIYLKIFLWRKMIKLIFWMYHPF